MSGPMRTWQHSFPIIFLLRFYFLDDENDAYETHTSQLATL